MRWRRRCPAIARFAAFYEENKATFDTYACVSHILVADKAKADDLAARIGRGEDFAALARAESTDNQGEGGGSAAKGGDLGCAGPGRLRCRVRRRR